MLPFSRHARTVGSTTTHAPPLRAKSTEPFEIRAPSFASRPSISTAPPLVSESDTATSSRELAFGSVIGGVTAAGASVAAGSEAASREPSDPRIATRAMLAATETPSAANVSARRDRG